MKYFSKIDIEFLTFKIKEHKIDRFGQKKKMKKNCCKSNSENVTTCLQILRFL